MLTDAANRHSDNVKFGLTHICVMKKSNRYTDVLGMMQPSCNSVAILMS